jgi:hypothetical protein
VRGVRPHPGLLGAPVLAAALLLASCTSGSAGPPASPSFPPSATRSAPGPVRHDPPPLTTRFAALGDPIAVTWQSGTTGDGSVPGPSTYWIDAVVAVQPTVAAGLHDTAGLTGADPPELSAELLAAAGSGPWQTGDAVNAAFSTAGFATQAYLGAGSVVVLRAIGSGDAG